MYCLTEALKKMRRIEARPAPNVFHWQLWRQTMSIPLAHRCGVCVSNIFQRNMWSHTLHSNPSTSTVVFVLRAQAKDAVNFNKTVWLYRGISGKTIDMTKFTSEGGTEMAPMSTSKSFDVAKKYRPRPHPSISLRISSRQVIHLITREFPTCTKLLHGRD